MIDENKILGNWESLIKIIENSFTGDRKEKLLELYNSLEDRMSIAPASGIVHCHNCFAGGYVDHVLRVIECAQKISDVWIDLGVVKNWTDEELIFSALNHDLGKIGDMEHDYYIPNQSEWHRKNQGKLYIFNPELNYMSVPDRSLYLLANAGIEYTYNEAMSIRLHDGLYDDANVQYLKTFNKDKEVKSHLPTIIHHADHMASRIEHSKDVSLIDSKPKRKSYSKKTVTEVNTSAKDLFKDLFKE